MDKRMKKKLLICAYNENLFKTALRKMVRKIPEDAHFEMLVFCYYHFSDLHPEVLIDVLYHENRVVKKAEKKLEILQPLRYRTSTMHPK
jgi:hypothetical protein